LKRILRDGFIFILRAQSRHFHARSQKGLKTNEEIATLEISLPHPFAPWEFIRRRTQRRSLFVCSGKNVLGNKNIFEFFLFFWSLNSLQK
jgi:hypothetical protein